MKYKKIIISIISTALLLSIGCFAKGFTKNKTYPDSFADVNNSEWYAQGIKDVYELGLMDGVSDTQFDIDSKMTVAQTLTIAARLHSLYNGTKIPDVPSPTNWYDAYVDYCIGNSIIRKGQFSDYDRPVMSFETVTVFAAALPESYFNKINNVAGILDVPEGLPFSDEVFMFYNAGILCGNDDYGTFLPTEYLTRARAATIISRIALPEKRQSFTLLPQQEYYDINTVFDIFDYQVVPDTLDKIVLMNIDGIDISGAEYRYYSYSNNGSKSKIEDAASENTALIRLAQSSWLKISRSALCSMLTAYYNAKTADYGKSTYYEVLESNRLSDKVFAKLTVTNELIPLLIEHFHTSLSPEVVSEYAQSSGYICARHILISKGSPNAYKTIKEVEAKLKAGGDFSELVTLYGQDPGMKKRPYGYIFKSGDMVKAFEDAAFALNDNQISGVVRTDYGFHIIQRLALTPEIITECAEYSQIASNAAVGLFNSTADALVASFDIGYVSNFDNLAAVID